MNNEIIEGWQAVKDMPVYELRYNPHLKRYRVWRSVVRVEGEKYPFDSSGWIYWPQDSWHTGVMETRFKWRALNEMSRRIAEDHHARLESEQHWVNA